MFLFRFSVTVLVLASVQAFAAAPAHQPDAKGFTGITQPFIQQNCIHCHGPKKQKGELRLDTLPNDFSDPTTAKKWAEVLNTVNSHEMPPEEEDQPTPESAGKFTDWLTAELGRAEIAKRGSGTVMRRINRAEYNNTIRDLVGIDFDAAEDFPQDPPAGGFDNIGQALTISPLHMELYYGTARRILDRAIVTGEKPPAIKWHFEPEEHKDKSDGARIKRDGKDITLGKGALPAENGFAVMHHAGWDRVVYARNIALANPGKYTIRFRAAGRIPTRAQVIEGAKLVLAQRRDQAIAKGSSREYQQGLYDVDLKHFETHRMYDYGAPRVKVVTKIGGVPKVIAEMDINATEAEPQVYEVTADFTKQKSHIQFEYAYSIPSVLDRDWQIKPEFASPILLIDWFELEGPINPVWPPESTTRLAGNSSVTDERERARKVLENFMPRAFRRLVTQEEIESRLVMFDANRPKKPSFEETIKIPLASVLTSSNFIYLIEPARAGEEKKLTPFEFASRLSHFLWSSMPDDTLFRLASSGDLKKPEVVKKQIDRMLADPKSEALVKNFTGQWLGLRKVGSNPPVKNIYPEYDRHLEVSIVHESEAFFEEILRNDLDSRNLIKSDFVTINERLARFYGIPGVKGDEFRKVKVSPETNRGGLVTQASIHSITSNGTRTSPISRGVWVLKTMLNTDPGLPVANAGELPSKVPGIGKATVRQRLNIHREAAACARCHDKIDPLGFSLENFNAAGEWRELESSGWNGREQPNDPKIDASATMPDGKKFTGVRGLQDELLNQQDKFLGGLSAKLHTYALGRELGFSDQPMVDASVAKMKAGNYTLRSLIHAIVASESFASK
ncbi:MAG: DUF1592 domain-containing protein [Verrucomicrobium sp.]